MDQATSKNFNFEKYKGSMVSKWGGYVSSADKTNVSNDTIVRGSQNMYKKLNGNWSVRPGLLRLGDANTTNSPISSEFVWYTSWGATYTMVVSNANLYVVINNVWYSLLSGLTATRYVFDKWWDNTEKKDRILFVHGNSDLQDWSGGFATILSTTVNTITKTGSTSWQQSGFSVTSGQKSIVINGNTYTYTGGESTTTLTGVAGDPTGESNGSTVLQSVITHNNLPAAGFNNDFIKVINNQAYIGSYTSRIVYISNSTDFTDYTVPTPRVSGSPELLTLDGTVRGIGVRQGNPYIGFGQGSWAVITFSDITVGTTLTQQTNVAVNPMALLQAPLAHEFIDSVGDNLIYLGIDQQVHSYGNFNDLFVAGYPSLSQDIATELSAEDFTGGGLRSIGEFIYVTAPVSGKVYLYQVRSLVNPDGTIIAERLWHSPFVWNATSVNQIDGTVVVFSNANPQIYQAWDTEQWHDDSPFGDPLPYISILALSYRGEERRQGLWSFDKVYSEGYMQEGTTLNLIVNYNYMGSLTSIQKVLNSPSSPGYLFNIAVASPLGNNSLGQASLGGGLIVVNGEELLPKFKIINTMPLNNCFEWQPIYYSDILDSRWEILAVATNADVKSGQDATFIVK